MRATSWLRGLAALILGAALTWVASAAAAPRKSARSGARTDTVLVRIGKEVITPATVERRLEEVPEAVRSNFSSPEGRQRLLERMVEERLWLLDAQRKGVNERPEIKRQLDQQRRDLLIRTVINEAMASNPAPADSDAKVYYDEHLSEYQVPTTVTLAHIQTRTEGDARKVRQWAHGKQDWKKLAAKYSVDTLTRNNGGALGTVTKDGVFGALGAQPALAESALAIGEGRIGGPWKSDKGWHVVKVDAVKPGGPRPFEQVRGTITRQLTSKHQQDFYQARLADLRSRLGVKADSAAIKAFVSQKKSARDMFNEAQSAGPAVARIEAYRKLLEVWPESEVSPQAQFMIGFIQSEELKDHDAAEKSFRELLRRYPKSELAASAQWMVDHMRTEGAPAFMSLEGDSSQSAAPGLRDAKDSARKP